MFAAITKTRLFKYTENFTTENENFQMRTSNIFIFLLKTLTSTTIHVFEQK